MSGYLVYSSEHNGWWMLDHSVNPNGVISGVTTNQRNAGHFNKDRALAFCQGRWRQDSNTVFIPDIPVRVEDIEEMCGIPVRVGEVS